MKIQEGVAAGINIENAVDIDAAISKFDKFHAILNGFRESYPALVGSEKQVKWASELRQNEVYIASKMIFSAIYNREYKKVNPNFTGFIMPDDRINHIGNSMKRRIKSYTHAAQWIQETKESWAK